MIPQLTAPDPFPDIVIPINLDDFSIATPPANPLVDHTEAGHSSEDPSSSLAMIPVSSGQPTTSVSSLSDIPFRRSTRTHKLHFHLTDSQCYQTSTSCLYKRTKHTFVKFHMRQNLVFFITKLLLFLSGKRPHLDCCPLPPRNIQLGVNGSTRLSINLMAQWKGIWHA